MPVMTAARRIEPLGEIAAYSGQRFLGTVRATRDGQHEARTPNGWSLGKFNTQTAAVDALEALHREGSTR
jgi:ABC-type arginine/histidine transport system permease subunit